MQQGFAGAGLGGDHDQKLGYVGGDEFGFPRILAIQQALARQHAFNHGLLAVDDLDVHPIAAGVVGALAAGAGFVGLLVWRADDVASAVAGDDLGGLRHKMAFRLPWDAFKIRPRQPEIVFIRRAQCWKD